MNHQKIDPMILDKAIKKWNLTNLKPLVQSAAGNNYVAYAFSRHFNQYVVLKVLLTKTQEIEALKLFNGHGCVKLLDVEQNLLLLEYIKPGTSLKNFFPSQEDASIQIFLDVLKTLQSQNLLEQAKKFKTVYQWMELLLHHTTNKIPPHLLKKSQQLYKNFLHNPPQNHFLHGDLHHENILKDGEQWIAIDPKGVIGPLEYEVGRFIMNPIPDLLQLPDVSNVIQNRVKIISDELHLQESDVMAWTFVQAILSACWTEADGSDTFFNYFVQFVQLIEKRLKFN